MQKIIRSLVVAIPVCVCVANAQEQGVGSQDRPAIVTSSIPDWQSRYQEESSRDYIRRRAQEKTAARQARIEGMRWLGHSPARPVVSSTPFTSRAPGWVSYAPTGYWGPAFWPGHGYVGTPGSLP